MTERRTMITGSLQKKKGIFYAVLNLYDDYGKRKLKWISTGYTIKGNKKKAEEKLEQLKIEYEQKSKIKLRDPNISEKYQNILFCDYMLEWLEKQRGKVEKTTYIGYQQVIKGRLYNYFKAKKIKLIELKPKHIQDFFDLLFSEGLSGNTIKHYRANISKALKSAVINELIDSNPATKLEAIKVKEYTADYYTQDELLHLMDIVKTTTVELPIVIAGIYGLRREEVIGIKWDAIDFTAKTLTIRHTVGRGKIDGVTQFIFKDRAKSDSGYRTLPLFDFIVDLLHSYKKKYDEKRKFYGNTYCNDYKDYICLMDNGELMKPGYITQTFNKILKQNELRHIRLHDLRHSCGTLLIQSGVPVKDIQNWLGHANFQTTLRYAHADIANKKISADVISSKLLLNTNDEKKQIT